MGSALDVQSITRAFYPKLFGRATPGSKVPGAHPAHLPLAQAARCLPPLRAPAWAVAAASPQSPAAECRQRRRSSSVLALSVRSRHTSRSVGRRKYISGRPIRPRPIDSVCSGSGELARGRSAAGPRWLASRALSRSAGCSSVKYTVPWCMVPSPKTGFPLPFGKSVGSDTHVQRPKGRTVYSIWSLHPGDPALQGYPWRFLLISFCRG